jgi:outer membrane protein
LKSQLPLLLFIGFVVQPSIDVFAQTQNTSVLTSDSAQAEAEASKPTPQANSALPQLQFSAEKTQNENLTAKNGVALTLEEAMRLAEERAIGARIASQNTLAADAKADQAIGQALPRLDLEAQKVWIDKEVNKAAGKSPQVPDEVTTSALQVVQPIIGLGPLLLQIKAANLQLENARNDEGTAKREARMLGAQAFLNAQKANQFVSLAEAALQVSENQAKEAQALLRAGRIAQADASRFELSALDAKQQLTQARITQEIAATSLAETLSTPGVRYVLESPKDSRYESQKPRLPALNEAITKAESLRPEAKNANNGIQIAEYYKLAGDLDYLPSLAAFARYERNFEAKDLSLPQGQGRPPLVLKKDDVKDTFSYGLKLNWVIWDWGMRWNRSSEYSANLQKARIAQEAAQSSVRLDVTSSYLQLKGAQEGLETAKSSVKLAEEVYRLTKVRFQNGQATSTDVVASERDQTRAQSVLVNARGDMDLAWIRYQKALGESPRLPTTQK